MDDKKIDVLKNKKYKINSENFKRKIEEMYPDIEVISEYVNSKTKIKCKCRIDGFEFEKRPNDMQQGHGKCPKCNGYHRMSNDEFLSEFYKINNEINILSEYKNRRDPILCECRTDGYQWYAYGYDLLHNRSSCRRCANREHISTEQFKKEIALINNDIEIVGKYINNKTPIECRCKICSMVFYPTPTNLKVNLTGCPRCNNQYYKLENIVEKYLITNNIKFETQKKFDGLRGIGNKPLSYDFFVRDHYLIECQGMQHEKPIEYFGGDKKFEIQKNHDLRKKQFAIDNGYQLIEIWYFDINKINEILDEALSNYYILSA